MTILAVDDDPDILTALRRALAPLGEQLILTEDPTEVLSILGEQPIALLISDIDMPQMTGLELMTQVRAMFPDVVRMLLTGRTSFESAMTAINQGEVHRYLNKPFEPAELRKVVQEALARSADLARDSRAGLNAERQRQLLEQLELEHPGLTRFVRDADGAYLVSTSRASKAERMIRVRAPQPS
jgi:DNA-binding NtrC family response regulator